MVDKNFYKTLFSRNNLSFRCRIGVFTFLCILIFSFFQVHDLAAQQGIRITGSVSDNLGEVLPGVGNWMEPEDLLYNNHDLSTRPHYKVYMPDEKEASNMWYGGRYDMYIFRLAETYLLRAEAYFWKGDKEKAAADINMVRRRANAREITAGEVNMSMIIDERARELYMEEPRKTELTRISFIYAKTGIPADDGTVYRLDDFSEKNFWYDHIMATTVFYNKGVRTAFLNEFTLAPYHVLWPIPQASINSNTNGIINQNRGYSGYERNVPPLEEIIDY